MSDDRVAHLLAGALCVLAVAWAAAVPLSSRVRAEVGGDSIAAALAGIPHAIGSFVCHQRRDRSFITRGVQWPVCGRCSGLYLSAAVAVVAIALGGRALVPSPLSASGVWRTTILIAAVPTLLSWGVERVGWWLPTSTTRAWIAVPLGATLGALIARLAVEAKNTAKT